MIENNDFIMKNYNTEMFIVKMIIIRSEEKCLHFLKFKLPIPSIYVDARDTALFTNLHMERVMWIPT